MHKLLKLPMIFALIPFLLFSQNDEPEDEYISAGENCLAFVGSYKSSDGLALKISCVPATDDPSRYLITVNSGVAYPTVKNLPGGGYRSANTLGNASITRGWSRVNEEVGDIRFRVYRAAEVIKSISYWEPTIVDVSYSLHIIHDSIGNGSVSNGTIFYRKDERTPEKLIRDTCYTSNSLHGNESTQYCVWGQTEFIKDPIE